MGASQITYENVVERLLAEVPALQLRLDEHVQANEEVLPHVFFGDVARFALQEASSYSSHESPELQRLLNLMEEAMGSSDLKVQNLVSVSFLENLGPPSDESHVIRAMLGPKLRAEFAHYWKEDPKQ